MKSDRKRLEVPDIKNSGLHTGEQTEGKREINRVAERELRIRQIWTVAAVAPVQQLRTYFKIEQPAILPGVHPDTLIQICFDETNIAVNKDLSEQPLAELGKGKEIQAGLLDVAADNADRPDNRPFQEEPDYAGLKGVVICGKQ